MWSFSILLGALLLSQVSAATIASDVGGAQVCEGQVTLSEYYIGQDKNVKVQHATCPEYASRPETLVTRQTNVCGNTCTTSCFTPGGGGPNTDDCHIIADALLYNSQNVGPLFTIGTGTNNTVVMQYASCLSFFVNQHGSPLEYCRSAWVVLSSLINFIAPNCAAAQNAHGGLCVATDQQWFVQVNHA